MKNFAMIACSILLSASVFAVEQPKIKDAESASHSDQAASYELINEYQFNGGVLAQFKLAVLSHYSYILSSDKEALLIDPGRDIEAYQKYLKDNNLTLKAIFLTHSHADFVAGHIEAATSFKVPVYISQAAHAGYQHNPIKDNDIIKIGSCEVKFLETPGHTLDGVCAVVSDNGKAQFMLSGDTLFVGSVGRPDLMGGTISAAELAGKSYDSWHNKLAKLPDDLKFFPAHGAGSLCGAHLKDAPFSTIGEEKSQNSYLQAKSRSEFIARILDGLPEAPQYFKYNAAMNRQGPELVNWNAPVKYNSDWQNITDPDKFYVVDLRDGKSYAAGHIPNSVNIGLRGRFENWVGIILSDKDKMILAADNESDLHEGVKRVQRIGYNAEVVLIPEAVKNGVKLRKSGLAEPAKLYSMMKAGNAPIIVDVRLPNEYAGVRIGEIVNLPLNHLAELSSKLSKNEAVVTVCNSAYRSSLAVGILERNGFQDVSSVDGGTETWVEANLPVFRGVDVKSATSNNETPARKLPIPDRIMPQDLQIMIQDLPGSFELVDIRPAADFADYSLPGAKNVDVAEVINSLAWRSSKVPLVLVDRDGSVAMAVGGILCRESERPVKVLYGGLEAYWKLFGSTVNGKKVKVEPKITTQAVPNIVPQKFENKKKTSPGC